MMGFFSKLSQVSHHDESQSPLCCLHLHSALLSAAPNVNPLHPPLPPLQSPPLGWGGGRGSHLAVFLFWLQIVVFCLTFWCHLGEAAQTKRCALSTPEAMPPLVLSIDPQVGTVLWSLDGHCPLPQQGAISREDKAPCLPHPFWIGVSRRPADTCNNNKKLTAHGAVS